jgi:hypothetical protein
MEQVKCFQTDGKAVAHERKINKWYVEMGDNIEVVQRIQKSEVSDPELKLFIILTTIFYREVKRKK